MQRNSLVGVFALVVLVLTEPLQARTLESPDEATALLASALGSFRPSSMRASLVFIGLHTDSAFRSVSGAMPSRWVSQMGPERLYRSELLLVPHSSGTLPPINPGGCLLDLI
jgi:hypothetical protein